ncbi:hypothetical protein [Archaeoglobus veneficus]|uniref:Uncharacterized protein n=1 Tax=Archaeoglobus veneficus (strain DSM 11195 / SNP6) TaxID=693661 RepID=F2KNQ3_ARCVS|nr:hypothetical protein [Archaeoglobus veneficus]AEA46281.1 hypothetical protein Arcve_0244 [Archaeoglobus veneficus SNP6]
MGKVLKFIGFGLAAVLILFLALTAYFVYQTYQLKEETFRSGYTYEIHIGTNKTLFNVTLFLPLPAGEIADELSAGNVYNPENWSFEIVDTEYGKMLKIRADEIHPRYPPEFRPIPVEPGKESPKVENVPYHENMLKISAKSSREINTKDPIGNEPLLLPKYGLVEVECIPSCSNCDKCYSYETVIYANYNATPSTTVEITIRLEGTNSWWAYGWSFNEYRDYIYVSLSGEHHCWISASGYIVAGDGIY